MAGEIFSLSKTFGLLSGLPPSSWIPGVLPSLLGHFLGRVGGLLHSSEDRDGQGVWVC